MIPTVPADLLDTSVAAFMRYFVVHINPILHRTLYRGRSYSEHEIIVSMGLGVVGALRPTDLSRGLAIDKGTLTSVLRRLRGLGLVERRDLPGDERSYIVALTDEGRAFVAHLDHQRRERFRVLFVDMDAEEIAAAARGFDLLTAHLRRKEERHAAPEAGSGSRST
jgi:DNA-binding MarR family transcriptional regulator